jgi:hypothetical protein
MSWFEDNIVDPVEEAAKWVEDKADDVVSAVEDVTDDVAKTAEKVGDWISEEGGELWGKVVEETEDVYSAVSKYAEEEWQNAERFLDGIADTAADAAEEAWERASRSLDDALEQLVSVYDDAVAAVTSVLERAWRAIASAVEDLWSGLEEAVMGFVSFALKNVEYALMLLADVSLLVWLAFEKAVIEILKILGGCLGGITVHRLVKAHQVLANAMSLYYFLPVDVLSRLAVVFPKASFGDVLYMDHSIMAQDWYSNTTNGMTFDFSLFTSGYIVYLKPAFYFNFADIKELLVHELVHVLQYRAYGSPLGFACAYGMGYAEAGTYEENPLEAEPIDFVNQHVAMIDAL